MPRFESGNAPINKSPFDSLLLGDAQSHNNWLGGINGYIIVGPVGFFSGADGDIGKTIDSFFDRCLELGRQTHRYAIAGLAEDALPHYTSKVTATVDNR